MKRRHRKANRGRSRLAVKSRKPTEDPIVAGLNEEVSTSVRRLEKGMRVQTVGFRAGTILALAGSGIAFSFATWLGTDAFVTDALSSAAPWLVLAALVVVPAFRFVARQNADTERENLQELIGRYGEFLDPGVLAKAELLLSRRVDSR